MVYTECRVQSGVHQVLCCITVQYVCHTEWCTLSALQHVHAVRNVQINESSVVIG